VGRDTRVDLFALRAAADAFEASAESLGGARLTFDGATAGRAHVARGDALRNAVERLTAHLAAWSRASAEIAATLRAGADRYADTEERNGSRFG
jgi:uncharacterized protein YukE